MRYRALTAFVLLVAPSAQGEVHRIVPETYYRTFSRVHPPLAGVKPGDTIVTKTLDAAGLDEKGISRHERGNPLTGPFYVEGAEAGDALVVQLRRLTMNRNWGWSGYRLGWWSVLGSYMESTYPNRYKEDLISPGRSIDIPWDIDLDTKVVRLREPSSGRVKFEFQARPMVGCIGVAAAVGFAPTPAPSGPFGGGASPNPNAGGGPPSPPPHPP